MKRPQTALDVDLLVEHGGHQLKVRRSGMRFVVNFPTLLSLFPLLTYFLVTQEASSSGNFVPNRVAASPPSIEVRQ